MRVFIDITGQPGGSQTLLRAITAGGRAESKTEGSYSSIQLYYNTKQEAKMDLVGAYAKLSRQEPDMVDKLGGISIDEAGDLLEYDASKAQIRRADV